MKEEIKEKWVTALDSTEYTKTEYTLRDSEGFCANGVLADLYIRETGQGHWGPVHARPGVYAMTEGDCTAIMDLPPSVSSWAGLRDGEAWRVAHMNDFRHRSFTEIAVWIKENL